MTMKIDTDALTAKITQLKEQQRIIAEVLEKFKGDTLIMDSYWSSNTGDTVKENLLEYMSAFDIINRQITIYVTFLESVVNGYVDEENMIANQIEMAANVPIGVNEVKQNNDMQNM